MSPVDYYVTILAVYMGTDLIAAWGLNLEFGVTGVPNLAYIVFFACGSYTYAVLTVGPASQFGGSESYIIGARLDPAVAILVAMVASALVGVIIGLTGLRRLRLDYQALAFLIISFIAIGVVGADGAIFNGLPGMSLIPNPLGTGKGAATAWEYVGVVALGCVFAVLLVRQLGRGPLGRALRAIRDDEEAASAVGKNVLWMRLMTQGVGAGLAGLAGALLAGFIGGWSPNAWAYTETMALITVVMIGGRGSIKGVAVGTILVLGGFLQGVQYLPTLPGRPGTTEDLGWILAAAAAIFFIFVRPQGLFPERRPKLALLPARVDAAPVSSTDPTAEVLTQAAGRSAAARTDGPAAGAVGATELAAHHVRLVTRRMPDGVDAVRAPGGPILQVRSLVRSYGGVRAVDEASFSVPYGSIVGLIGPNGAGKSTALGIISGFIKPDAGRVELDGLDVTRLPSYRRARIGLVRTFQLAREFPRLTSLENLLVAPLHQRGEHVTASIVGKAAYGAQEAALVDRARQLIELFGLAHLADAPAGSLSGGQKRLLELMRALMLDPKLLLLDEPMAGLSPAITERLENACLALREAGVSVLLVEHELGSVDRLCDNVIMMAQGRVLAEGAMEDLRRSVDVQDAYFVG